MSASTSEYYRPPEAPIGDTPGSQPTDEELVAFVGGNAAYYLPRWRVHRNGGFGAVPNLGAFFFATLWCFYRRMLWVGVAVTAGLQVAGSLTDVAVRLLDPDGSEARQFVLGSLPILACSIVWGMLANRVYYDHAVRAIHAARLAAPDTPTRLEQLRQAGGTRLWLIPLGMVAAIGAGVIITTVLDLALNAVFGVRLPKAS